MVDIYLDVIEKWTHDYVRIIKRDSTEIHCRINKDKIDFSFINSLPELKQKNYYITLELIVDKSNMKFVDIKVMLGDMMEIKPL